MCADRARLLNVGARQEGRSSSNNVIDVEPHATAILAGIPAGHLSWRGLEGSSNPYGTGHASAIIVERLARVALDRALLHKRFADLTPARRPDVDGICKG